MSNSQSRLAALMLFLALAVPATVLAQTPDTGDVHGVVLDASGKPAAGYPMKFTAPQGDVIIQPTEADGAFGVERLPPGNYEFRVYEPGGSPDTPIAAKQVTLAAGQKLQIEIRLGSDNPAGAAGSKSGGSAAGSGLNWTAIVIAAMLVAAAVGIFFAMRQRRPQ